MPAPSAGCHLAASLADPVDWRCGRQRYAVWLLPVESPEVLVRWRQLQAALQPWCWPALRQPHITLQVCGFTDGDGSRADDVSPVQLAHQWLALQRLRPRSFDLWVGGPDSFDAAAYLTVEDPGAALQALRPCLALPHGEFRTVPYRPHLTLGLYRQPWPRSSLAAWWRRWAQAACVPLRLPVTRVLLAEYDARALGGRWWVRQSLRLREAIPVQRS
ncbi:2'-5' RNA ligase family protein [Ideonella livida]|uniref:2'-5' RNA ligase family protein n=1 Tax=Ideonella livida TaxID=2707176 RepID=A0A7C9TIE8_9BURK|nr:2'-5' RNA ligase family protein [Ideonella livida]NDY91279.1 2'-5' RNA ligase family protein [Ideonella livida]